MIFLFSRPLTDGEGKTKAKKATGKGKAKKKKRKSSDKEALEDSDDGDYEGLEVDYMSDESRSDPSRRRTQRLPLCGNYIDVFAGCVSSFTSMYFCFSKAVQMKSSKRESPAKQSTTPKVRPCAVEHYRFINY